MKHKPSINLSCSDHHRWKSIDGRVFYWLSTASATAMAPLIAGSLDVLPELGGPVHQKTLSVPTSVFSPLLSHLKIVSSLLCIFIKESGPGKWAFKDTGHSAQPEVFSSATHPAIKAATSTASNCPEPQKRIIVKLRLCLIIGSISHSMFLSTLIGHQQERVGVIARRPCKTAQRRRAPVCLLLTPLRLRSMVSIEAAFRTKPRVSPTAVEL